MRQALLLTAAFAVVSLPPAARAEDEEIVVTATRTPTRAERLPARLEVIDRASIEAQGIATLAAAAGPQAVQSGGAGQQASFFLRGANSKHALALLDGVRLNDASTPNASYDFGQDTLGALARVEILRGPASTIYGSDAIGGVVNLIPRMGGDAAFEPFAEASLGSFETQRALLGAAGAGGGFAYGVTGEWLDSEGHDLVPERMTTHTGDEDGASISTLTAGLRHDAGAFALDALLRWRDSRTEFDTFSGGANFDLRADDPDLVGEATQTLWRLGGELAPSAALTLRVSGGQVLGERAEIDGGAETSSFDSARDFADAAAYWRSEGASLTAGLSFERNDIDTATPFATPLSVAEDQAAAFIVGQADLGPRIVATGSLRVDDYESFGTHATYAAGFVAAFSSLRTFASYATAFKAPSLSERFEVSLFNIGNPDLAPEQSQSWEIGADWSVSRMLQLGGSYYETRIEDLIEYRFALLQNVNVGEAKIDGAELFAEVAPANWSRLRLSYAWTDARDGLTGQQLLRRPEHSWRFEARVTPLERLTLALSWAYVGDRMDVTYADSGAFESPADRVTSFDLGSVSATFDLNDAAQIFVRVDNVADQTYEQPAAFAGAPRGAFVGARMKL